ncbi:Serine aminopeptidase S33 [Gracilaria domingensis]|nr:Serine aminopeptidase S33 [Gracilaria domingensis]
MLTAPAVRVYPKPILKLFAPLLGTLAPLLPVQRLKFDRRRRRVKKEEDDGYDVRDDPLVVRSPVRARVGYEVLKSCEKIMSEAERFRVPVFVAHSRRDRVTNAKGTIDFHDRIGSSDKTVRLYDGGVHDLLAEKRDMVMEDMVFWASKRL